MKSTLSKSTPYAPINEINGGVVTYLNQGANYVVKKRRDNAYKKMHEHCKGDYRIVSENSGSKDGVIAPAGEGYVYGGSEYVSIKFECIQATAPPSS
jgi:hypothetical protein